MTALRLRDHALVSDRTSAALIAADGTVDWWCPGGWDEHADLFALVHDRGGRIRLAPLPGGSGPAVGIQRYPGAAAIVETELTAGSAAVVVADELAGGVLTRVLTVRRGPVDIRLDVVPGEAFGPARRVERWSSGIAFGRLIVRGLPDGVPVRLEAGDRVVVTVARRDDRGVVHARDVEPSLRPDAVAADRAARELAARAELGAVAYDGPHRGVVLGAVRLLHLLTDARSGALIGSPCTSLPARTGNERNVDERFAAVRDNARVVHLWERLERFDWAARTRTFLAGVAGDELPLAPWYRADGSRPSAERESDLSGWNGHTPVRVGSRAAEGLDLSGMALLVGALDARRDTERIERLCDWLADHPLTPDHGRWDERTRPKLLVASQLAVRTALAARAAGRPPLDPSALHWLDAAGEIDQWLVAHALGGRRPAAVVGRSATDPTVDAAVLRWLASLTLPGDDTGEPAARLRATLDTAIAQLGEGPFCHRYGAHVDDGFPPGTSPDVAASFELVAALAAAGRYEEAHDRMDALIGFVGELGLPPAFADRASGDHRGNLACAAAAISLVEAALALTAGPR